jgi:protocatechuate 4,5-dioxygenase alpha subunit
MLGRLPFGRCGNVAAFWLSRDFTGAAVTGAAVCGSPPGAIQANGDRIREAALDDIVSGAYVFTGERSARSYALNKMANSLSSPDNRAKFQADEAGYMRGLGCSEQQIDLVAQRDWRGMLESGASIYLLLKIGAAVGVPLPEIGAHTAGMTLAEYQARKGA